MKGPEHYQAAEQLIDDARTAYFDHDRLEDAAFLLAIAEVRATLALAAATAAPHLSTEARGNWNETGR